ncbi:SDR family oxidoreductase [Aldersonia sp. NBC_00410]|uniref:SDR family oxidoreductase n=1 Tax=Aldersonia sp. NBC_00410 TaxID=2975954 RepID=UPI00224F01EC|nr:SDR family oxidoreductase [Aldersonia sp. NBC_00410]MCX5046368.1 SDR family oxidoreductase [Aldersonia sp. NBC_00410]
MSRNPSGRTYVITGAASGIGLALVTRILDREPTADILGIDLAACPDTRVRAAICDLSDLDAIADLDLPDHVDALANVAGVPGTAPAGTVLAVNTLGMRALTFRVLDRMGPGASIVNVASIAAHRNTQSPEAIAALLNVTDCDRLDAWLAAHPIDGPAAYDTSKRAVVDWTVALSAALQSRHIRANAVSPGPTETPILVDFEASMGVDAIARSAAHVGRHGTAAESAAAVAFLLSEDAAWINGIDLPVEGGLTATRAALLPAPLTSPRIAPTAKGLSR